jgi:uncharacterized FlaG/YvyC family protein
VKSIDEKIGEAVKEIPAQKILDMLSKLQEV